MKHLARTATLGTAAMAALAALSACGTTDTSKSAPEVNAVESTSCADDSTETTTAPVILTDDLGRTVTLDKPAERVIALEWQQIEDVLSLCVAPVAVADAEGYATWDTAEELPAGTTDVGTRQEPNTEAILKADPDLIVVEATGKDDPVIKQFQKYGVPVLAMVGADTADPIQKMKDTFTLLGVATGRSERAETVLTEFDDHLAAAKKTVAEADLVTTDFVYFDGWIDGGNVALRPFGQGSLVGDLGEELGLKNAWPGPVDEAYGLGQTDIEGMTEVGDATLLHTGTVDPAGDVFAELKKNDVWANLPAVKDDRYHAFPEGIWTFGGPRSAEQIIDAYLDVIAD